MSSGLSELFLITLISALSLVIAMHPLPHPLFFAYPNPPFSLSPFYHYDPAMLCYANARPT